MRISRYFPPGRGWNCTESDVRETRDPARAPANGRVTLPVMSPSHGIGGASFARRSCMEAFARVGGTRLALSRAGAVMIPMAWR